MIEKDLVRKNNVSATNRTMSKPGICSAEKTVAPKPSKYVTDTDKYNNYMMYLPQALQNQLVLHTAADLNENLTI